MDSIRKVRIKHEDGSYSESIPIGANSDDIAMSTGGTLTDNIKDIEQKVNAIKVSNDNQTVSINNLITTTSEHTTALAGQQTINENQQRQIDTFQKALTQEKIYAFENVAEMKNSDKLLDGMYCVTKGYHSNNDGGNGEYLIRIKKSEDTEDNGNIHFLKNNLVAELIVEDDTIRPEQFGAYGDGTHDDTTVIQSCIRNAQNTVTRLILQGMYLISSTVYITNTVTIEGTFKNQNGFKCSNGASLCIAKSATDTTSIIYEVRLKNFKINGNKDTDYGLLIGGEISQCFFDDLMVTGCNKAAYNIKGSINFFDKCYFYESPIGCIISGAHNVFNECNFWNCDTCFCFNGDINLLIVTNSWLEHWKRLIDGQEGNVLNTCLVKFSNSSMLGNLNNAIIYDYTKYKNINSINLELDNSRVWFSGTGIDQSYLINLDSHTNAHITFTNNYVYCPKCTNYINNNNTELNAVKFYGDSNTGTILDPFTDMSKGTIKGIAYTWNYVNKIPDGFVLGDHKPVIDASLPDGYMFKEKESKFITLKSGGGFNKIPIRGASYLPLTKAATIEELVTDFNKLLSILKDECGLIF